MIADVRIFLYFFYQCMYSIHVYTGSETDVYEKEGQRKGGMSKRGGGGYIWFYVGAKKKILCTNIFYKICI